MSSTSTASDIAESPPPSVIADTASTLVSVTSSRHYALDEMTVFKVEDILFRFDRTLLDQETDTIPRGVGSKEDPIELDHRIKAADLEILLDFLKLGTRHDKKPLMVFDWASIIAVCYILGMQRVQNLACESLSDPQKALLDRQKALLDRQNVPLNVSRAGAGFDRATCGLYFLIREKGTTTYLGTCWSSNTEGVQLQLWHRHQRSEDKSQIFFVDNSGALHHAASGLAVDIIDDVPALRRRRPVSGCPNPWSHPLPEFSFVNSQIRIKFLSDPSLPGCTDDLYPDNSWATKNFVLAARTEKDCHMHPISDFSPWIPATMVGSFEYQKAEGNHTKQWRALVEERTEDVGGERTSWEIVPASQMAVLAIKSATEPPVLPDIPLTTMSAVSKFNSTEMGAWQTHTTETHKPITFSKPFAAPPGIPIGLNTLDIDGGAQIRVKCSASDITKTDFVVHVDCWEDTKLYSAGVSWLEVAPGDLEYQHGQFATTDYHPWEIISFLTSLDMARDHNWRVITKVTDIDENGFTIHIDTWLE
ncbi:hypothetical protein FIBSPDRAFT_1047155 [Athelia psychrophila]|uniref:H-type lectin domain-containing protein n=1 Tax=Athelia psychrophila TaxID=1759441 RepID=A0A166FQI3_9AGAM|nr:hypothetical protein FIBSPDRAFT_1047155 [Fibularhizoctonia sp. CBS 109695]